MHTMALIDACDNNCDCDGLPHPSFVSISVRRLGLGNAKDHYHPVECSLPGGHERWRVISIACGGRHSLCLAMPMREGQAPSGEEAGWLTDSGAAGAAHWCAPGV